MLSIRYSDHGLKYSLYLRDSDDLCHIKKMVRVDLSATKVRAFRGMAIHEPSTLVNLRSKINGTQAWHNLRWIRKAVS